MSEQTKCPDCLRPLPVFTKLWRDQPECCFAIERMATATHICDCHDRTVTRLRSELELARAVCEAAAKIRHGSILLYEDGIPELDAALAAYKAHQGASK